MNDDRLPEWHTIFPEDSAISDVVLQRLVISMVMRGYIRILGARPELNINAGPSMVIGCDG